MTEQEIEISNKKIELHNKFCFMKKQIPKYKKLVPLSHFIVYAIVSAMFLAIPTFLTVAAGGIFSFPPAQLEEIRRSEMIESEESLKSDEMKKFIEEKKSVSTYLLSPIKK